MALLYIAMCVMTIFANTLIFNDTNHFNIAKFLFIYLNDV